MTFEAIRKYISSSDFHASHLVTICFVDNGAHDVRGRALFNNEDDLELARKFQTIVFRELSKRLRPLGVSRTQIAGPSTWISGVSALEHRTRSGASGDFKSGKWSRVPLHFHAAVEIPFEQEEQFESHLKDISMRKGRSMLWKQDKGKLIPGYAPNIQIIRIVNNFDHAPEFYAIKNASAVEREGAGRTRETYDIFRNLLLMGKLAPADRIH